MNFAQSDNYGLYKIRKLYTYMAQASVDVHVESGALTQDPVHAMDPFIYHYDRSVILENKLLRAMAHQVVKMTL